MQNDDDEKMTPGRETTPRRRPPSWCITYLLWEECADECAIYARPLRPYIRTMPERSEIPGTCGRSMQAVFREDDASCYRHGSHQPCVATRNWSYTMHELITGHPGQITRSCTFSKRGHIPKNTAGGEFRYPRVGDIKDNCSLCTRYHTIWRYICLHTWVRAVSRW